MPTTASGPLEKEFIAKILGYGTSQCGKTTFIGTMPEDRDDHRGRFVINMERKNILPLQMAGKKFEWEDITNYEHILKVIVALQARFAKKDPSCPKTVALDGGGELYTTIMRYILKNNGDLEQPRIQDYFTAQNRMLTIIDEINLLPCHTYISFHDAVDKDELTGEILGGLAIPGRTLPGELLKKFNMVLHFEVSAETKDKPSVYQVCTKKTRRYVAGDKTTCLAMYEEPDFGKMLTKINKRIASLG